MDDAKTIFIVTGFDASEQVRGGLEPTRREIVAPVPTTPAQISLLSLSPASPPPHREPRFPRPSQREISTLAESVDAVVDNEFTAERPFDYCVAKTTASRKYELARTLGKPIVTMAWLRDSASSGALLPTDDPATSRAYRPAAFLGLNVCVTGYTQDQRADLEAKVVANGGAYCPDLVRDACTHLVASSTTSAKFKHASKWPGVCVVKREWVDASIRDGRRADESLFVVRKETEAEAALAALKREREEDAATPWDACYLLGCRVCLYDLGAPKTSEPAKRAARLLRRGAGAVTTNPAKATHVVVSKSAAVGSLKAIKEHRDKVVYTSWLEACDVEMDVVDMDEHLVHAEMFSGGGNAAARPIAAAAVGERFNLSQEAASQGMSKGKSKPRARPAAEQEEPRRREGPASPNPLTRQALAATAAAEAQALSEAAAAKATEVGDQNVPPIESTRAKVNANDVGCSYDPATGTELPATAIAIPETRAAAKDDGEGEGEGGSGGPFEGMSIGLSRLLSKEEDDAARDFIAHGGGIAVTMPTESDGRWASSASSTSYVVCPAAPTAEERKVLNAAPDSARKHVTCHWLERCVEAGLAIPLSGDAGLNPAYRPLPCDAPLESMQRLRVSTSLYDESVKESVHMLCRLLGAKYTDNLRRNKNTHLVVPTAEGTKYEAAKKWGLHVVTVEWLHACVKAGRRVSEVDFPPPRAPDDDADDAGAEPPPPPAPKSASKPAPPPSNSQGGTRDLSNVLRASQPAPRPSSSAVAAPRQTSRPSSQTVSRKRPVSQTAARAPRDAPAPRHDLGSDATTQGGPGAESPSDPDGIPPPEVAIERARASHERPATLPPDGSQFVANLIDDIAGGLGFGGAGGETQYDAVANDGFDGFRVPEPVAQDGCSTPKTTRCGDARGETANGSAGRKRAREEQSTSGATGDRTGGGDGTGGGGRGDRVPMSQAEIESQHQMVGYAEDGPPSRVARRGGGGGGGGGRNDSGLVNSLLGQGGVVGGSGGGGKPGGGGVARAAVVHAEDWA